MVTFLVNISLDAGVVVVSHDARLILETNCVLWECADRTLHRFDGNFEDYRDAVLATLDEPDVTVVEGRKVVVDSK